MRRGTLCVVLSLVAACSASREGTGSDGGIGTAGDESGGNVTTTADGPTRTSDEGSAGDGSGSATTAGSTSDGVLTSGDATATSTSGDGSTSALSSGDSGSYGSTSSSLTSGDSLTSGGSGGSGGSTTLDCNGTVWACGNGSDDDGDGLVDLADPECTGPCDNDEASFATGLPGDNKDCKQDCFFDGNSGAGDDGCEWNLKCDPNNPGAGSNCEYTGGTNCVGQAEPNQQCLDYCTQFVPAGCDCFGCCRVETGDGSFADIFLGSGTGCSLDNLEACNTCTYQADVCGNECEPTECELCFGQDPSELPPECNGQNTCDSGSPCTESADCGGTGYCSTGCCYPFPS